MPGYRLALWRHGFLGTAAPSPLLAARRRLLAVLQLRLRCPCRHIIVGRDISGAAPAWARWQAHEADYSGPPEHVGCGASPLEAVDDLLWHLDLDDDIPLDLLVEP